MLVVLTGAHVCAFVLLQVAPITAQHIFKLVTLGAYTGNHIFRCASGAVSLGDWQSSLAALVFEAVKQLVQAAEGGSRSRWVGGCSGAANGSLLDCTHVVCCCKTGVISHQ